MAKKKTFDYEVIRAVLDEAKHSTVASACRKYGVSEPTYYIWKRKYGSSMGIETSAMDVVAENKYLRERLGEVLVELELVRKKR